MRTNRSAMMIAADDNQSLSKVFQLAEEKGSVVVYKDGRPKLLVIDLDTEQQVETKEVRAELVARRILEEHITAFEELAK